MLYNEWVTAVETWRHTESEKLGNRFWDLQQIDIKACMLRDQSCYDAACEFYLRKEYDSVFGPGRRVDAYLKLVEICVNSKEFALLRLHNMRRRFDNFYRASVDAINLYGPQFPDFNS